MNIHCPAAIGRLLRAIVPALVSAALVVLAPAAADATNIERVVTPGGIEVWLVRDPTVAADRDRLRLCGRQRAGSAGQGRYGRDDVIDQIGCWIEPFSGMVLGSAADEARAKSP